MIFEGNWLEEDWDSVQYGKLVYYYKDYKGLRWAMRTGDDHIYIHQQHKVSLLLKEGSSLENFNIRKSEVFSLIDTLKLLHDTEIVCSYAGLRYLNDTTGRVEVEKGLPYAKISLTRGPLTLRVASEYITTEFVNGRSATITLKDEFTERLEILRGIFL